MTPQIALTLALLLATVILLVWDHLRADLVALLVLVALALSGLVSPSEAVSGFSNPAVITVWAVFILSAGLARTGVANVVGRYIIRLGHGSEARLLAVIMVISGVLSAFMNNVGVAAMLLPVTNHIARKTRRPASRLLMPLAFGCLLGGMTTLIGTPTNVLASDALRDFGLPVFNMFDFVKVGLPIMLVGILYMVTVGRRLLPQRDMAREFHHTGDEAGQFFELEERFFTLRLPEESRLAGKRLAESRLGSALKLNVIGITRSNRTWLAPDPDYELHGGDQLLVIGKTDWLQELSHGQPVILDAGEDEGGNHLGLRDLMSAQIAVLEAGLPAGSELIGQSLAQCRFREQYEANVLAIWREDKPVRTNFQDLPLRAGDTLLVQASRKQLMRLRKSPDFEVSGYDATEMYHLQDRLLTMAVPAQSHLVGKSLAESHLADAFGLSVLGILHNGASQLMPAPETILKAGDKLLVEGKLEDIEVLRGLQELQVEASEPPALSELESEVIGLVEAVISPHSKLEGSTLRQLNFRDKFGLSVLAIWRGGRAYRSNLRELPLHFGDSLLIYGHRDRIKLLAEEEDFLVLAPEIQEAPRREKARLATAIMGGVVLSAGLGWLPIHIAAVTGAALMVLADCLTMEEAYRSIKWQAIFLIAGMLPLGLALENSGAAQFIGERVVTAATQVGPLALLAALFTLTAAVTQIIPSAVVLVVMAPIALSTATSAGLSPEALVMLVAVATTATFLTPVSHPANVLVMGPGNYRFGDFTPVGLPIMLIMLLAAVFLLPIAWPLVP